MLTNKTIVFLGAGSMAEAMIAGILESKKVSQEQIIVTNRSDAERLEELRNKYGIQAIQRDQLSFSEVDVIVLAMKPKDAEKGLASIRDQIRPDQVVLSVLAGISTAFMEENLQAEQQVVRGMPNTSSMIGQSATAISPGRYTGMDKVMLTKKLLEAIGEVYILDEDKMDIFTGIAGSGPAYFYYFMEHIERVGIEAGLTQAEAKAIGAQTILGAAKMMIDREETPSQLKENVTSPNGTTAAGLEALAANGGGRAIEEAIRGAAKRSQELAEQLEKQFVTQ